jgi:hypothetical protein
MRHQLMRHVVGRILGLQPDGAVQGLITRAAGCAATLEPQTAAQQYELEGPVLAGVDGKAAGHGLQLLTMDT